MDTTAENHYGANHTRQPTANDYDYDTNRNERNCYQQYERTRKKYEAKTYKEKKNLSEEITESTAPPDQSQKKRKSRRLNQRLYKRQKIQQLQLQQKKLNHIKVAAVHSAEQECDRTYGFHADPNKSRTKNFNQAIRSRDHRKIKNQPTNLAFHNLCTTKQPPENTGLLLGLNLKYCVASKSPKPDLKHTISRLVRSVRTQSMLVQKKIKNQHFIQQLYKKDKFYNPPLATDEIEYQLAKFEEKLEAAAEALPQRCKTNLTQQQCKVLHSLKNNQDFIILPSDKNLGPAIMNRADYMQRVLTEHLHTDAYIHMPTEQANAAIKSTTVSLKFLYRQHKHSISKQEQQYFERSFRETHRHPMFYIMPKIQKKPIKYRPVVSCVNSFNAVFSTWLDYKMKSLLHCIPTYIKDSNALLQDLQQLPHLPANARIFTADATAMYTNIDCDTALEAFNFLLDTYAAEIPPDFPRTLFMTVLGIIMKHNLFQFDDTFWLQKDGTAMGTPTACLYATIAYGIHERHKLLPKFSNMLLLYKRFIDDVLGIWKPSTDGLDSQTWEEFKTSMNEWGKLRWVISERSTSANFLDLTLTITNGKIISRTFQKSMNLYLYIPPVSAHPTSCFKGLIVGNFLRFRKQNENTNFCALICNFARHLLARGHPIKAIKKHFLKAAEITDKKQLITSQQKATAESSDAITNRSLYLHWEFHPKGIQRDTLRAIYDATLSHCNPFHNGMVIAMLRPKNLRDLITRTTLSEPEGTRASDYHTSLVHVHQTYDSTPAAVSTDAVR